MTRKNRANGDVPTVPAIAPHRPPDDPKDRHGAEARWRTVVEHIEDGYYEVDLEGRFTFFNDSLLGITGYGREELGRMDYRGITNAYTVRRVYAAFRDVYRTGIGIRECDWEFVRKDGEHRWVDVSVALRRDARGEAVGFMGIARDVTLQKRIAAALEYSEERYRTIIETIEDGYYEVDLAGDMVFFNPAMARIVGYPPEELLGMNNRRFMDGVTARKVYSVFNRVYRTGVSAKAFDWELVQKDGTRRFVEVSVSLVRDAAARPVGFRGIARDVTERKSYEDALRAGQRELQAQSRELDEVNVALRVLLRRMEQERSHMEGAVRRQVEESLKPCWETLRRRARGTPLDALVMKLKTHIDALAPTEASTAGTSPCHGLSAAEIDVARLIRQGLTTKEIADLLGVSPKTIETHRSRIRKKLGLVDRKVGLRAHLIALG